MPFPDTPKTVLNQLKQQGLARVWESAWDEFFDLYHLPIRMLVRAALRRAGWLAVSDHDIEDVVTDVFTALVRGQDDFELKPERGKFRQFLSTLCHRKSVDFIRRNHRRGDFDPVQDLHLPAEPVPGLADEENEAFRSALVATLLDALRKSVSPQVFIIFELVKLIGHAPAEVAAQLGVRRGVVDNSVFKAMTRLRELATDEKVVGDFTETGTGKRPANP